MKCTPMTSIAKILPLFILVFCIESCTGLNKKKEIQSQVEALIGHEVGFGSADSLSGKPRILILVPDTGDCTTCTMQIYDWYVYKLDIEKNKLDCNIVYLLHDSARLSSDIQKIMGQYHLYNGGKLNEFIGRNTFLKGSSFNTLLLDKNNTIQLVGDPIADEELWKLYKEVLAEDKQ